MERSGVSDKRCVHALCDLFCHADAGRFAEVVDHFTDRGSSRIDPVDVSEERGCRMVIDVDDELLFEIDQPWARNVGTLDHKHGVIRRIDHGSDAYIVCAGKLLVSVWNRIAHDDFDVFIKRAQQPVKTERRSEAVAVGTDMRGDRETTLCLDQLDYLTKHLTIFFLSFTFPLSLDLLKQLIDAFAFFFDAIADEVNLGRARKVQRES